MISHESHEKDFSREGERESNSNTDYNIVSPLIV
jgi:hypothetical protein